MLGTKVLLSDIVSINPTNIKIARNTFFIYLIFIVDLKKLHGPHGWCSTKLKPIIIRIYTEEDDGIEPP